MNLRTFVEVLQKEVGDDVKTDDNETTVAENPELFQGEITSKDGKFITVRNELGLTKTALYTSIVPVSYEGNSTAFFLRAVSYFSFVPEVFRS